QPGELRLDHLRQARHRPGQDPHQPQRPACPPGQRPNPDPRADGMKAVLTPRAISWALAVVCLAPAAAPAAPALTHLFPAGGQRRTRVEGRGAGTFPAWPVKVWVGGKGVTAEAEKDKGKLAVRIAADTAPGVYWLRCHDQTGGSNVRPFIVGTLPEV